MFLPLLWQVADKATERGRLGSAMLARPVPPLVGVLPAKSDAGLRSARAKLNPAITVARREEKEGCICQLAVDQATRYLKELA